jgi:hypothetical protein
MQEYRENRTLTNRLEDAGYCDPSAAADFEGLNLKDFARKVFSDLYKRANNPQFSKKESIIVNGKNANGLTNGEWNSTTKIGRLTEPIQIAKLAFSSYLQLASTMGHELNHAIDYINRNMGLWYSQGGHPHKKTMTESRAYNWVLNNGGIDNVLMRTFYNNQLNR